MKHIETQCCSNDDLEELGSGSIENGIQKLEDDRWFLTSAYDDIQTGLKYYWFERNKNEKF